MAKKGFDIKALMLNHAEKLGASVIGLIALTGLATASWKTCDKDQGVLVRIAEQTKSDWLSKNPIPEEKTKELAKTPDVGALALRMASPNEDIAKFSTSRRWNPPIYDVQAKLATVKVSAPQDPEADLIMVSMVEKPEEDKEAETESTDDEKKKDSKGTEEESKEDSELKELFGQKTNAGTGVPGDGMDGGEMAGGGLGSGVGPAGGRGGRGSGGLGMGGPGSGMGGPGMGSGRGSGGLMGGSGSGGPGMGGSGGLGMGGPGSGGLMGGSGSGGLGMGGPGSGGLMGGRGSGGLGMGGPGSGMGMGGMGMGGMGMGGMGMGGMGMGGDGMDGYSYGMGIPTEKKVRLVTGVSVRLVFDLYQQTKAVAEALHIPEAEAGRYIDFVNLQIERKRAVVGPDPWAGEWEPLTLDELGEILEVSYGTDPDIVQPGVIRPEITMPLVRRRSGEWTPANASHKRLEKFELSAEEKEVIELHKKKMLEEAEKMKAMLPREQAKSEGWRKYQIGSQDLQNSLGGASDGVADSLFDELNDKDEEDTEGDKDKKKDSKFKDKKALREFLNRQLAAQRLLLVRFMDFTCDRGTSYQYRVRLEMRNPNFDRPIDELEEPEQADLQTIFSAWSDPSPGVFVPHGYRYYPQKVVLGESASMTMFYENESAGTPVLAQQIEVPIGTRVGGNAKVDVVDLGKDTLSVESVELKSRDFLASVTEAPKISKSDLPELKEFFSSAQSSTKPFGERITVIDSNGAIVVRYAGDSISVGSKKSTAASDRQFIAGLLELYKDWRDSGEPANLSDPYGGEGSMGSGMMGGMGMGGDSGYNDFSGGMSGGSAGSGRGGGRRGGRGGRGGGSSGSGGIGP